MLCKPHKRQGSKVSERDGKGVRQRRADAALSE